MDEITGIVTEIVDLETIKVKVINSDEIKEIKGDKFYISALKESYENDEAVIIKFYDSTNRLKEDLNEGDL